MMKAMFKPDTEPTSDNVRYYPHDLESFRLIEARDTWSLAFYGQDGFMRVAITEITDNEVKMLRSSCWAAVRKDGDTNDEETVSNDDVLSVRHETPEIENALEGLEGFKEFANLSDDKIEEFGNSTPEQRGAMLKYEALRTDIASKLERVTQDDIHRLFIDIANSNGILAFVVSRKDFERMAWEIDERQWQEVLRQNYKGWIHELLLDGLETFVVNMPATTNETKE